MPSSSLAENTPVKYRQLKFGTRGAAALFWCAIGLLQWLAVGATATELRFDTAREWQQWRMPQRAVDLSLDGTIRPVRVNKNINAALNAVDLGGGIRGASSNVRQAIRVIDGDLSTGWRPSSNDSAEKKWIEVDLGRAVSARRIALVFAEGAPPFELFDLLLSTGEPFRSNAGTPIPGTLVYRIRERFKGNGRHRVTFDVAETEPSPIQFVRLELLSAASSAELVEIEVEAIGDNLALGALENDGSLDILLTGVNSEENETSLLGIILAAVDGDMNTRWSNNRGTRAENDVIGHMTLDLGAVYWLDAARLVGFANPGRNWKGFGFNFYEVMTSDGSLAPDGTPAWQKQFSGWPSATNRRQGLADHEFTETSAQFVRISWKRWDAYCGAETGDGPVTSCFASGVTTELQVFGEGYPARVRLRSPILDLGAPKNVYALRWGAEEPPGMRVEIRSRSGHSLEANVAFHDKDGKEVTEKRWKKLIPSFRGPVDTTLVPGGDWSPWSSGYQTSGQEFLSPSLRRYVELDVRLVAEMPQQAAALDWVSLEFADPLVAEAAGEIFPTRVEPGVENEFSYYLRSTAVERGFDRLVVEASTPVRFVEALLNGETVAVENKGDDAGFRVQFSRPVRGGELVELRFSAAVFVDATRFDLFLESSDLQENVRQRVEAGDASGAVESSTQIVRLPLGQRLLANFSVESAVVTPNGDGRNDRLVVAFDLVDLMERRPLRLCLYDLAGRQVRVLEEEGTAGARRLAWDGRDESGALVPPGHYVLRLDVEGDARRQRITRLVQVVY